MKKRIEYLKNEAIDLLAVKKENDAFLEALEDDIMMFLNEENLTKEEEKELKDLHYNLMSK